MPELQDIAHLGSPSRSRNEDLDVFIRSRNGRAEWVDVRKGVTDGDRVEVSGDLKPNDLVVQRATDEIREGDSLQTAITKR